MTIAPVKCVRVVITVRDQPIAVTNTRSGCCAQCNRSNAREGGRRGEESERERENGGPLKQAAQQPWAVRQRSKAVADTDATAEMRMGEERERKSGSDEER